MASHPFPVRSCLYPLVAFYLVFSAIAGTAADAQERIPVKTVDVIGSSPLSEGDPAAMRERALEKGLEAAVIQVAAEVIGPDVFARKSDAIHAALLAKTRRYIETYRVLEEIKSEQAYQVVVQASVSVDLIVEELHRTGIMKSGDSLPKILFLTSQQSLTDVMPQYWWSGRTRDEELAAENAMIQALNEKGFDVISRSAPGVRETAASEGLTPHPDDLEAVQLGLRLGAGVVVVGQATAHKALAGMEEAQRAFQATASLRALEISSGNLLASAAESMAASDADERSGVLKALAGVGAVAGRSLAAALQSAWLNRKKEASVLRMEVEGTRALAEFVRFRKILKDTEGVRGLQIENLKPDQAVIAVDFNGGAQALAAKLMGNSYPAFGIEIVDLSPEGLKVRLVRQTAAGGAL